MRKLIPLLIVTCFMGASFIGCEPTADQNFNYQPGDSLLIVGPEVIVFPQDTTTTDTTDVIADTTITAIYSPSAYTVNKQYEWTVEGAAEAAGVRRDGLYFDVEFSEVGTSSTIKLDDGEYVGAITVTTRIQTNEEAGL